LTCLLSSFFLATIATPRENSTANQSQLVENLFDDQLRKPVEKLPTPPAKPVESVQTANEPVLKTI